jgi:mannose-6-phosphate isomerase-like protein (cupin superfamily)
MGAHMKMTARMVRASWAVAVALVLLVMAASAPVTIAQQAGGASQQSAPADKTFASAADVSALLAKAKGDLKPGQPDLQEPTLRLAPYTVNVEYRVTAGPPTLHKNIAEVFYVLDGAGTLEWGGKLQNEKQTNPTNLTGTGIDGGMSKKIAKGDVFFVPENTPHGFSAVEGTLQMMVIRVPRPVSTP